MSRADTFSNIYRMKGWGDNGTPFYSGTGSSGQVAEQYCNFAIEFIRKNKIASVVDLGCGDFAVGRRIVDATGVRYTGIDVVPELIRHHQTAVNDPRITFCCADIVSDPLPTADLYLVRQVLQHLSNDEIGEALGNLRNCSRALISEHVPIQPKSLNRDKPHGPDIRWFNGSGIYLDKPPFSIPVVTVWEWPLGGDALLRTCLVDPSALNLSSLSASRKEAR